MGLETEVEVYHNKETHRDRFKEDKILPCKYDLESGGMRSYWSRLE